MDIEDEIVQRILNWYKDHGRSYLWRQNQDPYGILIAEMMLQRTKSDQVARVYTSFLKKYPNPTALANSDPREIERFLRPLGLRWRARKLWEMGRTLIERFNGTVPDDYEELLSLPGVGQYAASAVLCFAFGKNLPVIDANVCRVVSRLFDLRPAGEARRDQRIIKKIHDLHAHVLPEECSRYNWAILDLAAIICTPRKPLCPRCPLNSLCRNATA
ncbi:MAG: DNA glycosylase [Nitrososphaerota archaeon]